MVAVFQFKGIKPKTLDLKAMQKALLSAANKAADDIEKQFEGTVATWNNKPSFEKIVDLGGSGISILIGTDDRIYKFVNDGTHVRHALMSSDWISKTQPRTLRVGRGAGHVVAVSKKIVRPGIEAREFDKQIQKEWDKGKRFKRQMEKGMREARKASGRAI